ncbi:hypothetical protein ECG_07966 [Echinococcus granulosus]|nr:hypothetical protein ECG_07966 [Echinococcus granulosus]
MTLCSHYAPFFQSPFSHSSPHLQCMASYSKNPFFDVGRHEDHDYLHSLPIVKDGLLTRRIKLEHSSVREAKTSFKKTTPHWRGIGDLSQPIGDQRDNVGAHKGAIGLVFSNLSSTSTTRIYSSRHRACIGDLTVVPHEGTEALDLLAMQAGQYRFEGHVLS